MVENDLKPHAGPQSVSDEEWMLALEITAKFIAKKLYAHTNGGAFDENVFGMPAYEYFSKQAFEKLYTGKWKWCSYRAVHTQLIRIAISDMRHHVESWELDTMHPTMVEMDERLADRLADDDDFMDLVYERAEEAARGDEDLLQYLTAMRRCNNYELIGQELGISLREVYQRQRKLIRRLQKVS